MPASRPTYTATFERAENGTWVVQVVEEPNVHGYGDTLPEARRNIRDAITTLFGPFAPGGDGFELVEDVRLPEAVLATVRQAVLQRQQAHQRWAAARAAEEAAEETARQAQNVTSQAARLLMEHGEFLKAEADDLVLVGDVRLPEVVLLTVQRAHVERETARQKQAEASAALGGATTISREAVVINREAARLLTTQCGLTVAEAAGLLGLSTRRTQQLVAS